MNNPVNQSHSTSGVKKTNFQRIRKKSYSQLVIYEKNTVYVVTEWTLIVIVDYSIVCFLPSGIYGTP